MDFLAICKDIGLTATLILAVASMFFFLLKWVLEQFKDELTNNRKERVEYLRALDNIREEVKDHNLRSREFMNSVVSEHKEMIKSLGRINGYKAEG